MAHSVVYVKDMNCGDGCRNRRCLDPLLPTSVLSSKCSPADESCACPRHLSSSNVVSESNNDGCKDPSVDRLLSSELRHNVVEASSKTSPSRFAPCISGNCSTEHSTPSTCRRRSQKFSDSTTWSRFRQQKAATLKLRSEKVFAYWQMFFDQCIYCFIVLFDVKIVSLEQLLFE